MIERFQKVIKDLYRGGAPSIQDVKDLKDNYKINKIVSLDKYSGESISRICKLLNINHIKVYIDGSRKSLLNCFKHDIKKLLLDDGPTFLHCAAGKDRTGMLIAVFKCKYLNEDPEDAIKEAEDLGFGIGVDEKYIDMFKSIIRNSKLKSDVNNLDIANNVRDNVFMTEPYETSFAVPTNQSKDYYSPEGTQYGYNPVNDQSKDKSLKTKYTNKFPLNNGVYNNNTVMQGLGPSENIGGKIYE